jgi:hypothetical protein
MGEGGVRELKRGIGQQMLRSGCPKRLWYDCIIRETYVRSHTSLNIFVVEGQVPESKLKGETVDISTIAKYDWYELGIYLGAAIDIGPAMARKILKKNGSLMHITSVRPLTPDEIQSLTENKERE